MAHVLPRALHRGEVEFRAAASGGGSGGGEQTEMRWTIEVRPLRGGAGPPVRALTSLIVPAFARRLASRLGGDADGAAVSYAWDLGDG